MVHRRIRAKQTLGLAAVASLVAPSVVLAAQEPNITSRLQPLFDPGVLQKVRATVKTAPAASEPQSWPEYTSGSANAWVFQPETDWTSAFFPDELYALDRRYSLLCPKDAAQANGTDWREAARTWSAGLYNPSATVLASWGHDVGFNSAPMIAELALDSSNETARQALVSNAETLASLFSPVVGCTRSWDRGPDNFEVVRVIFSIGCRVLVSTASFLHADHRQHDESTSPPLGIRYDRQRDVPYHGRVARQQDDREPHS